MRKLVTERKRQRDRVRERKRKIETERQTERQRQRKRERERDYVDHSLYLAAQYILQNSAEIQNHEIMQLSCLAFCLRMLTACVPIC